MVMTPAVGVSSPAMSRSVVDFPQPEGPSKAASRPDSTANETPATAASLPQINALMSDYMVRELGMSLDQADVLRRDYWLRYGTTVQGLMRHHGVRAAHFLHHTHLLPGLEGRVHGHARRRRVSGDALGRPAGGDRSDAAVVERGAHGRGDVWRLGSWARSDVGAAPRTRRTPSSSPRSTPFSSLLTYF